MPNGYDPTKPENLKTLELIKSTHPSEGPIMLERVGRRFSIKKDPEYWKDFEEVTSTDSIGTKAYFHWITGSFDYGAQDAAAMVWNDLIETGAVPYIMQDQILIEQEYEDDIHAIVKALRDLCFKYQWNVGGDKSNPVIISGGDTSINNLIKGFDIGITSTGKVRNGEKVFPNPKEGDLVIGVKSSGLHSNGFTDVRETINNLNLKLDYRLEDGTYLGKELTKPTEIYVPAISHALEESREYVDGLINITGGAYSKLKELTRDLFDIVLERKRWPSPQPIFNLIYEKGKWSDEKMYTTLNNGVGYLVLADRKGIGQVLDNIAKYHDADIIGYVKKGSGKVKVESKFSDKNIVL